MGIMGIWGKWKEQKRTNEKIEELKENRKQETHQKKKGNRKPTKKVTLENSDQARGNGAWESRESEL